LNNQISKQEELCHKLGVDVFITSSNLRVGISRDFKQNKIPINGLRHPPHGNMNGWYLWLGEIDFPDYPDYFEPVCMEHISDYKPEIIKFMGLPPGWRFLIAGDYEDIWYDENLLDI
jgi:hypothetical protein